MPRARRPMPSDSTSATTPRTTGRRIHRCRPAAGVDQLLATGVERMARRADLHVDLRLGRARGELVAARAGDVGLDVFRMDFGLHGAFESSGPMSVSSWPWQRGSGVDVIGIG